jgi:hypothetical protein
VRTIKKHCNINIENSSFGSESFPASRSFTACVERFYLPIEISHVDYFLLLMIRRFLLAFLQHSSMLMPTKSTSKLGRKGIIFICHLTNWSSTRCFSSPVI